MLRSQKKKTTLPVLVYACAKQPGPPGPVPAGPFFLTPRRRLINVFFAPLLDSPRCSKASFRSATLNA